MLHFMRTCGSTIRGPFRTWLKRASHVVPLLTVLVMTGVMSQPAIAQNYEYKFTMSSGGDQLLGDIVTTTNNGVVFINDVVSWNFTDLAAATTIQGSASNISAYGAMGGALDTGFYVTPTAILLNDWVATTGPYLEVGFHNAQGGSSLYYETDYLHYRSVFGFNCNSGCATNMYVLTVPGDVSIPDITSLYTEAPPPGSAEVQTTLAPSVPEPSVLAQLGVGLLILGGVRRFRRGRGC